MFLHHSKRELRRLSRIYSALGAAYIASGLLTMQSLLIFTILISISAAFQFYLAARAFIAYQEYEDRHTK